MSHSQSNCKGDPRHLALIESIQAADPDYNNFRTSQVAPGCVAGPENWVFHTYENWARYFGQYTYFKKKPLREQQKALARDPQLAKLISRIDRQLADKTVHFDRSDGALWLDRKYYALWDSATPKVTQNASLPDHRMHLPNTTSSPPSSSR